MPGRYTTKLQLKKLNRTIESLKARAEAFRSGSENEEEEEDELNADFGNNSMDEDRPTRSLMEYTPHASHPSFNQGLGQNSVPDRPMSLFPSCAYTVALPVYISSDATPIVEPCYQRTQSRDEWMRVLQIHKSRFLNETAKQKQREKKEKEQIYNINLFEMADNIATQENPHFCDSYDYYYTGGNLNLLSYGTAGAEPKQLAMHVSGSRLEQLHFSQVGGEAELWRPLHSETFRNLSSEIFELMPVQSFRVNHGNMFLARMLNEIAIYEFKELEQKELVVGDETDEDEEDEDEQKINYELSCQGRYSTQHGPFISVAQAMGQPNRLAMACQDRTVRFKDLVTDQDISKHEVCILKGINGFNTWAQLRASQENCFHYACQSALITIDMRCANDTINPCFASGAYSTHCETFSCLQRSLNPNLLYVASNHKLHCLDMRCLGKKVSDRAVVTWTHQMSYSPTFMDAIAEDGSEFLALGSALPSDQRVCELKGALAQSYTEMWSPSLPYVPPQLDEALLHAQLQGSNVDIYAGLTERIKCCTTGLKFHRLENAIDGAFAQLLTANSIGDVHTQRVTLRDELEMQREVRTGLHTKEAILYYAELLPQILKRRLRCTSVQHMPVLREVMKSSTERAVEPEKPVVVEDVTINYGFSESETENETDEEESSEEQQPEGSESEEIFKKPKGKGKAKEAKEATDQDAKEKTGDKSDTPKSKKKEEKKALRQKAAEAEKKEAAKDKPAEEKETDKPAPSEIKKKKKAVHRGPWQKSAYSLSKFTDLISTRLLSIWDVEEFELTRDVDIDMVDEKLKVEKKENAVEERTAAWLREMMEPAELQAEAALGDDSKVVPGTNLPKRFDVINAEFREITVESFSIQNIEESSFDDTFNISKRKHSTLASIIDAMPDIRPPPAKKAKSKHVMGF